MIKQLINLRNKVFENANQNGLEAWFYPEYQNVKGFFGTANIILLGLNPSSGTFPSKKDKLLYNLLIEKKLEQIHITDFIKVRAKNKEVPNLLKNKNLVAEQVLFLKEEIEILNPKIIIPMGIKCEELLKKYFSDLNCTIKRIKHYGFRYQSEEDVFKEISKSFDEIIK